MGERIGRVEVVCGPMFAGKSEELIRRVRRARIAGRAVEVVGHALDTRRDAGTVGSHSGWGVPARGATRADELEAIIDWASDPSAARPGLDLLAVDEVQFFGPEIVPVLQRVAARGVVVVAAGLDVTFDGRPFEPVPALAALAERVTKLTAVCAVCGEDAAFHTRRGDAGDPFATVPENVGGAESYEARCRRHLAGAWWSVS